MDDAELRRKVGKMYFDMYEGQGRENPSVTSRLTLLEAAVERINLNSTKALWLLLSILATGIGNVIMHLMGK